MIYKLTQLLTRCSNLTNPRKHFTFVALSNNGSIIALLLGLSPNKQSYFEYFLKTINS